MNNNFYSDGTLKVERHTLVKEGFNPIKIRKILGEWEMLANVSDIGDERWEKLSMSEEVILSNIAKYEKTDNE